MTNQVHTRIEHVTPEQHLNLVVRLRDKTDYCAVRSVVAHRVKEPVLSRVHYPVADRIFRHVHPEPWWKYHVW